MARPTTHQRHALQLISRVLNTRASASPFTLILDDLNQRAHTLVREIIRRALSRDVNVVFLSLESTRVDAAVRWVRGWDVAGEEMLARVRAGLQKGRENVVVVDSLGELAGRGVDVGVLFGLVAGEGGSLVGVYHTDVMPDGEAYAPQPLELFKYMATTILTCRSFGHVVAAKRASERSLPEPGHGLLQEAEGVVQCVDANDARGMVVEAEFRRKSGRGEGATYFVRATRKEDYGEAGPGKVGALRGEFVVLLEQVPGWKSEGVGSVGEGEVESTFSLGLTEKQKVAREGVVLPYFDAQKGEGAGEGGRILYDMGEEDDFDEEEDEI